MFTRDSLIEAAKPKTEVVEVPEWGDSVTIRELTAAQIVDYKQDDRTAIAKSIIASVINENGELMFRDPEDVNLVLSFAFDGCIRLNAAINKLNGSPDTNGKN